MSQITNPIRYPDTGSTQTMTKRAWWLVVLNVALPGSVQVLAGNRRLGRFGLGATLAFVALAIVTLVVYKLWPEVFLSIFTSNLGLWAAALALAFYAVVWLMLTLDTLRLVRLVRAGPRARPIIAVLTTAVMVLVCGTAGYGAYVATTASGFLSDVFVAGPTEPPVDGRYNVLLLGGDAGADRDGLRPDSISVVSVDATTGQATMISLPRNLEDVPFSAGSALGALYPDGYGAIDGCDTDACILNSIYTEGEIKRPFLYPDAVAQGSSPGIEATKEAAQGITGLEIQYFVLIDMQGFSDLVDALGGVDIDVQSRVPVHKDESFTSVAFWFEPGMQHMDGYHALWFARSRHGTSDYDRINRQRQLQEALLAQASPANVLTQFQGVAKAGREVVKTDVPQGMLGYFVNLASKTKTLPIEGVALTPDNGVDPENPDYANITALIDAALAPPATDAPAQ
ncbi:transcriptional regulator [Cryobacterium roopkundense]|uniref:LCP family protein required for cell wall assembly n=1 Tax=Cryobacterium roopkundense TaxID=1001240 RepID=A0A099JGD5_9MICO|nr:LCP family protein [Cryobacterium roopkundense]KGJ77090.1 transcriptional regulator [Cryobacterium roopkundense]MBB5642175.1 LCP family protein required for cell wall assembly [Cryobacterium roopkundense]